MEHRDPAIKAEMLRNEIEMIKENMKSGYADDRAEMAKEVAVREKELAELQARIASPSTPEPVSDPADGTGVLPFESAVIDAETESDDAADIRANIESVTARLAKTESADARALYTQDLADLKAELTVREKELAERLRRRPPASS